MMDKYTAAEQAYKNGYANGKKDALEWIPVAEKLPEKSDYYLAFTDTEVICVLHFSAQYKLFNAFDGIGTEHKIHVTHWMPLPQQPKGE